MAFSVTTKTQLIVFCLALLPVAFCYICDSQYCITNGCKTPNECDDGRWIKNGGLCGCCDLCVKPLAENGACSTRGENGIPNKECGSGLYCDPDSRTCVPRKSNCVADQQQYDEWKQAGSLVIGRFRPRCNYMGDYEATQCITGSVCFCVTENGERIFGTDHYTQIESMNCKCSRGENRLRKHVLNLKDVLQSSVMKEADAMSTVVPFAHCMPDGRYDSLQCVGENCFCYDDQTDKLKGTMMNINVKSIMICFDPSYHDESYYRSCESERATLLADKQNTTLFQAKLLGTDPPDCDLDGSYAPVQCQDNKCHCVYSNGSVIESYEAERYSDDAENMNCYCARDKVFILDPYLSKQMNCLTNGNYAQVQCRGNLCFCVNSYGLQTGIEVDSSQANSLICN